MKNSLKNHFFNKKLFPAYSSNKVFTFFSIQNETSRPLINHWLGRISRIGMKIRKTDSWDKFKKYFRTILDGLHNHHRYFCYEQSIYDARQFINSSLVKDHCDIKEAGCKGYCNVYCDHFVSEYSLPTRFWGCSRNQGSPLEPRNEEIDLYLTNFLNGEDCSKQISRARIFATSLFVICSTFYIISFL